MPTGMSLRGTRILGLGLDSILASSSRPFGATEIILPGETKTAPLVEFGRAVSEKEGRGEKLPEEWIAGLEVERWGLDEARRGLEIGSPPELYGEEDEL
jgi:hypothetical protein